MKQQKPAFNLACATHSVKMYFIALHVYLDNVNSFL